MTANLTPGSFTLTVSKPNAVNITVSQNAGIITPTTTTPPTVTYDQLNTPIERLTYVNIINPANNDVLAYENGVWINSNSAGGAIAYANAIAQANIYANNAFNNAISFVVAQNYVNASSITGFDPIGSAANAYSNAISFVGNQYFVNTSQLSSNLSNYATTGSVTSNAAAAYANAIAQANIYANNAFNNAIAFAANGSTVNTGTIALARLDANVVSNTQLSANLGNYQTTAGLSSNVATLTSNNTYNLNGVNNYITNTGNYTISGVFIHSANIVLQAGVSANGSYGTANQVLTSNGTTVYWANAGGGFTNGQSISVNNFVITGALSANSSNGTNGQLLSTNGSSTYWTTPTVVRQLYVANGSQNTFTVTGGYTPNNLDVYLNGVKLLLNSEVNTSNGSTFTILTNNPANGTNIEVVGTQLTVTSLNAVNPANITGGTFINGFSFTSYNAGVISSGTFTPSALNGNYQYYTANGAHTIATPTTDCALNILITNGTGAGTITFSGYNVGPYTGDNLTLISGNIFLINILRINGISSYMIKAYQ